MTLPQFLAKHLGVITPVNTPGTTSEGTSQRFARADHDHGLAAWPFTTAEDQIDSDVTLTDVQTWYDGPSVSLEEGTWLLVGHVLASTAAAGSVAAKLWNGTTVVDSCEQDSYGAGSRVTLPVSGFAVVASGTETWKISAAQNISASGATMLAANPANGLGAGNNASSLRAVRIG